MVRDQMMFCPTCLLLHKLNKSCKQTPQATLVFDNYISYKCRNSYLQHYMIYFQFDWHCIQNLINNILIDNLADKEIVYANTQYWSKSTTLVRFWLNKVTDTLSTIHIGPRSSYVKFLIELMLCADKWPYHFWSNYQGTRKSVVFDKYHGK